MRKNRHLAADGFLKPGLKLIGAKQGQTKLSGRAKIYMCRPPDVSRYFEPFIGSGSILIGKERHAEEFASDINPYCISFFKCMQTFPDVLFEEIQKHVESMEKGGADYFHKIRKNPPAIEMDVHNPEAWKLWGPWFYIITKYCFNGIYRKNESGECNSTYCGQTTGRGIFDADWFEKVRERVADVKFYPHSYQFLFDVAEMQEHPENNWIVLDPPYWEVFTAYDKEKFKKGHHYSLYENLRSLKSKWLLTINDHPEIRELYKDFNQIRHDIFYSCSQTAAGRGDNAELIITNYPCTPNLSEVTRGT